MLVCGDCGYCATRGGAPVRDCRNPNYIVWNRRHVLPGDEACPDYQGVDTLRGRLLRLGDAMKYAVLANRLATGEIVGRITDPQIPEAPRKRKAKK